MKRRSFIVAAIGVTQKVTTAAEEWIELFDGHSLNGWSPSENKDSWKVVDGQLAANGPRSHLFYTGAAHNADFKNFELAVELTTKPECNSGVYFHTRYQETGFPEKGFEVQVNNTAFGDKGYLERKKTGSLYGIRNMYKQLVPDEKPFRMRIAVRGKNVQIHLNGELLVDYIEPTPPVIPDGGEKQRFLDHGTFALQCHNDGSKAFFKSVRVRPLPDDLPAYIGPPPVVDDVYRDVINIGRHNVPVVDYHVYVRDGMTIDQALKKSRQDGIQYGITLEAAKVKNDGDAARWLRLLANRPVFAALSSTDGQWTHNISKKTAQQFDYILAAGDTKEPLSISDPQTFIDSLVEAVIKRLDSEPIDVYSNATWLPAALQPTADDLWTRARLAKLIDAFVRNKVAIELGTLEHLPNPGFILAAKDAGCKFAFGTANHNAAQLKRCEYGLRMVEVCKLDWHHFFVPSAWWPKAVDRRWPAAS